MVLDGVHDGAARGFSLQVEEYERSRPGYPPSIVDSLLAKLHLSEQKKKVLDLAAGTGKFTRHLHRHSSLKVVAVDQSPEMVAALKQHLPDVAALQGSATDLPAEADSLDALFVAQGFHWFANEKALREMHRVLKPGAPICFLWNREDVSVPWLGQLLTELVEPLSSDVPQYWKGTWRQPFQESAWVKGAFGITDVESKRSFHKHSIAITKDQLWGRLLSKSYISLRSQADNAALRQQVDALLGKHSVKFDGPGDTHEVPLILEAFVAHKV